MNNLNVILILSTMNRTGCLFFQSLLDSHPEIISLPMAFNHYTHDKYFPLENGEISTIIDSFIEKRTEIFDLRLLKYTLAKDNNTKYPKIDKNIFKQNFLYLCECKKIKIIDNFKDYFELIHLAYALTLKYNIHKIKYIVMHVHNYTEIEKFNFLFRYYPNLKTFMTIREYKESTSKYYEKNTFFYPKNTIRYKKHLLLWNIFYLSNKQYEDNSYLISKSKQIIFVDLFTLHRLQDKAMQDIAKILDIKYDKILCKSTFAGIDWLGNSSDGKPISTFDINKTKVKWQDKIPKNDLYLIDLFANSFAKIYGYKIRELTLVEKIKALSLMAFLILYPSLSYHTKSQYDFFKLIKSKKDIHNPKYKKLPFKLAKFIIYWHVIIRNSIDFYKFTYNIKNWIKAYKNIKKAQKFIPDKDIIYINDRQHDTY